jgi:hypothetical protein
MVKKELRRCNGLQTILGFWLDCQNQELAGIAAFCLASAICNNGKLLCAALYYVGIPGGVLGALPPVGHVPMLLKEF